MSLYGNSILNSDDRIANSDRVLEMLIVDDTLRGTKEQIKEFCESDLCKVLQERQVLKKPTLMRLSKADEEKRRIKLIAYELARDAKDPEYAKLQKYTKLRKESIAKIMKKYGPRAEKVAKKAVKNYIAIASKGPAKPSDNAR